MLNPAERVRSRAMRLMVSIPSPLAALVLYVKKNR
jgi:hypothetical protein